MTRRQKLSDFITEIVDIPDFAPGQYGMDLVIRGRMDDNEWRRWNAISRTSEMKQFMLGYKKEHGLDGLREAISGFLRENNIPLKDDQ